MPEIKHTFTSSKMNKDLDERLVPNGEYRHAENIQVSTSEGSDMGSVQNLLSNYKLPQNFDYKTNHICVGSIADEKNDTLYYFVAENGSWIPEYTTDGGFLSTTDNPNPIPATASLNNPSNYTKYNCKDFTPYFPLQSVGDHIFQLAKDLNGGDVIQPVVNDIKLLSVNLIASDIYTPTSFGDANNSLNEFYFVDFDAIQAIEVGMILDQVYVFDNSGQAPVQINYIDYQGEGPIVQTTDFVTGAFTLKGDVPTFLNAYLPQTSGLTKLQPQNVIGLVFRSPNRPLNFDASKNNITGINIIDDMLFWTDGRNEPKKINISECIEGTDSTDYTRLVNKERNINITNNIPLSLNHVTVIKKAPTKAPSIELLTGRDYSKLNNDPPSTYTGVITITTEEDTAAQDDDILYSSGIISSPYDFSTTEIGDILDIKIDEDTFGNNYFELLWDDPSGYGQTIVFKEFDTNNIYPPSVPITDYTIKGIIEDSATGYNAAALGFTGDSFACSSTDPIIISVRITEIVGFPPGPEQGNSERKYAVDLFDTTEKLFEFKFPRFATRYKYKDGQYSSFSPWTPVAFLPGSFDYHPKKGYNIGMTNKITEIKLKNFRLNDTPLDVEQIDILYKEEGSPNVYVVDSILDNQASFNTDSWSKDTYTISDETINHVVPSNQLLRPYDNVPKTALAQEVTGSRIVYGNYTQGLDVLVEESGNLKPYSPRFQKFILKHTSTGGFAINQSNAVKSIKSLREYQIGVVFTDRYGRETPVITNPSGSFKLDKKWSGSANRLRVGFTGGYPENMKYYKFYIKETSGEYYNMAMSRWYDAEDGNAWISFPSTDRNKIDIDTFLILKKAANDNNPITEEARYKVLAIESQAPDFIKTSKELIATAKHTNVAGEKLFPNTIAGNPAPKPGSNFVRFDYHRFQSNAGRDLVDLTKEGVVYIEFTKTGTLATSDRYKVTSISTDREMGHDSSSTVDDDNAYYFLKLAKKMGSDVNFISNDPTGFNSTKMAEGSGVNIYLYKIENRAQFDGRFFVKLNKDDVFNRHLSQKISAEADNFRVADSRMVYMMANQELHELTHGSKATGHGWGYGNDHLVSSDASASVSKSAYNSGFGLYACYFRKYDFGNSQPAAAGGIVKPQASYDPGFNLGLGNVGGWHAGSGYASSSLYNNPGSADFTTSRYNFKTIQETNKYNPDFLGGYSTGMSLPRGYADAGFTNAHPYNYPEYTYQKFKTYQYPWNYALEAVHGGLKGVANDGASVEWWTYTGISIPATDMYEIDQAAVGWNNPGKNWMMTGIGTDPNYYNYELGGQTNNQGWHMGVGRWKAHVYTIYGNMADNGVKWNKTKDLHESPRRDEEVWFVDYNQYKGIINDVNGGHDWASLPNATINNTNPANSRGLYGAALDDVNDSDFRFHLSFGPVLHGHGKNEKMGYYDTSSYGYPANKTTSNVWNLGEDNGNPFYTDNPTKNFIEKIKGQNTWRWTDDPNSTLFNIQDGVSERNTLRYDGGGAKDKVSYAGPNTVAQYTISSTIVSYTPMDSFYFKANRLSPNYNKTWKFDNIVDNDGQMNWIPVFDPIQVDRQTKIGPIGGSGLKTTVTTIASGSANDQVRNRLAPGSGTPTSQGIDEYYIVVTKTSFENAESAPGVPMAITQGLIITQYDSQALGGFENASATANANGSFPISNPYLIIRKAEEHPEGYRLYLTGYLEALDITHCFDPGGGVAIHIAQPTMNGYSENSAVRISMNKAATGYGAYTDSGSGNTTELAKTLLMAVGYEIQFLESWSGNLDLPENPAIWETEPKDTADLDIYYEASDLIPLHLNSQNDGDANFRSLIPLKNDPGHLLDLGTFEDCSVSANHDWLYGGPLAAWEDLNGIYPKIIAIENDTVWLDKPIPRIVSGVDQIAVYVTAAGTEFANIPSKHRTVEITLPNNTIFTVRVDNIIKAKGESEYRGLVLKNTTYRALHTLNYHNCYSFLNGVESNRIRDGFNLPFLSNGIKASTTLETDAYKEEHRKYGLIFSGIYNSTSKLNELNQFITAEKITKDINPIYGSIQKLHSRNTDLITLCEDKVLKILANKDAVFNADGNPQLTANINVLGQTIPFIGEYGISKNPESFASQAYRAYFTDKQRGAVMRLSKDGLTAISNHGMKDWFRDNLKLGNKLIGSYDDRQEEYNIAIKQLLEDDNTKTTNYSGNYVVSFKEDVKGWTSFKSFIDIESGLSMANNYYTFYQGQIWHHHSELGEPKYNSFYNTSSPSMVTVLLNEEPSTVKSFKTLNYEGSQAKITSSSGNPVKDGQYYNLVDVDGWYSSNTFTDLQAGGIVEFIEKERKWFNYIKGSCGITQQYALASQFTDIDDNAFNYQGIGIVSSNTFNIPDTTPGGSAS